jgi:putative ABC transport system permease protein
MLRTMLTMTGTVLGVTVFVGMRTANQSVLLAFSQTVNRIAGKTELQVTLGETGFNEDVLEKVQSAATVRVAVPVIEAVADSNIRGQGHLLVLGIDMTGDRSLRDYDLEDRDDTVIDDPLVFLAQPDSIILSKEFAGKNHIAAGSRLTLGTVQGEREFTVRGIMKSSGLASAYGGNLAIMDIYAAQRMFGRGRTFDRIDLAVKPGTKIADCQRELTAVLGPAFEIQPPSGRGAQFETLLAGYSMMVGISSAFALFIGMFIIYNSLAIAVVQRRSEIGVLRALGATRGQIQRLFLGEGALIGLAGSAVGLVLGNVVARAIASSISTLISDVYGVAQRADEVATDPWLLTWAVAIGVATSVVAAVIPARQAAHVDPVQALPKGKYQLLSAGESRLRMIAAAVLVAVSIASLAMSRSRPVFYAGYVSAIIAALLLTPLLSVGLARTIRPLLKWLRPVEGALAADSLIQAPRRTSASVAAVMLSLALVVAFAGIARGSVDSIVDWINTTLDPDLFVLPSQRLDILTSRFPATLGPEIAALPGVQRVQMERDARITFQKAPVMVVALDLSSRIDLGHPVAGDADDMYRKTAAGEGLIVSANLAELQHLALGQVVVLQAPYGAVHLPIVGIVVDYSDQRGAILMDRRVFATHWHDDSVNVFRVYVNRGVAVSDVRQRIMERYAGQRQVFVLTNGELKSYILNVVDQWFQLTSVQIAVAVLVAILGIVNTLTVSVMDRRRELGMLQAVGALRGQVRRTIWLESLSVATLGVVLGGALGAINLFYILQMARHDIVGMPLDYVFPGTTMLALIPIMLGAGVVAAVWPAESAVRGSLVEALEYE